MKTCPNSAVCSRSWLSDVKSRVARDEFHIVKAISHGGLRHGRRFFFLEAPVSRTPDKFKPLTVLPEVTHSSLLAIPPPSPNQAPPFIRLIRDESSAAPRLHQRSRCFFLRQTDEEPRPATVESGVTGRVTTISLPSRPQSPLRLHSHCRMLYQQTYLARFELQDGARPESVSDGQRP